MKSIFLYSDKQRISNAIKTINAPCVAIFDVGTRAVRILVAPKSVPEEWENNWHCNDSKITNIGLDVVGYPNKILPLDAPSLNVTIAFIKTRSAFLREKNITQFSVIATAWLRWLANKEEVIAKVQKETGLKIEVIPQEREAELTISSLPEVLHRTGSDPGIRPGDLVFMLDQGGGSLEVSWMKWGQKDKRRPHISVRRFPRLGTVRLRQEFFNHDAAGSPTAPETNRAKIHAQVNRIQLLANKELFDTWDDRVGIINYGKQIWVYAVGSAITNIFPTRTPHKIQGKIATLHDVENGLIKISEYYDTLKNPVSTIYRKMHNIKTEGRIDRSLKDLDLDLTQIYGLPISFELLKAIQTDQVRILGYPLRFGYYLWKYFMEEPISSVRSDVSGPYVFLSYAHLDKTIIHDLLITLDTIGVRVGWDEGLVWGDDYVPQLTNMIKGSKAVICCLTPDAIKSDRFVNQEVDFALRQGVRILPLELRETILTDRLDLLIGSRHRLKHFEMSEDRFFEAIKEQIPPECFKRQRRN